MYFILESLTSSLFRQPRSPILRDTCGLDGVSTIFVKTLLPGGGTTTDTICD